MIKEKKGKKGLKKRKKWVRRKKKKDFFLSFFVKNWAEQIYKKTFSKIRIITRCMLE